MKIWMLSHIVLMVIGLLYLFIPRKEDSLDYFLLRVMVFYGTMIVLILIEAFIAVLIFM